MRVNGINKTIAHSILDCPTKNSSRPYRTCHTATLESVAEIVWHCGRYSRIATLFPHICHTATLKFSVAATLPHYII